MRGRVLIALALFLVGLISSCGAPGGGEGESIAIGRRAPIFSLKSLDGTTVTSRSLEGSVVVLNFWATWCGPCIGEIPDLKQVAAQTGAKVVGIALDEDGAKSVRPFVQRYGIDKTENYMVLLGDQELFQRFNGYGIPYTMLLDRSQRVVKVYRGPTNRQSLEEDLRALGQGT